MHDVPKLGHKYDVKDVSSGHALNFLVPKGLAEVATERALARVKLLREQTVAERKIMDDILMKNMKSLSDATIVMKAKTNEKGHLFAGIHKAELIPEIKKQTGIDMTAKHLVLEKPIKEVGEHTIEVKVGEVSGNFKVVIEGL